MKSPVQIFTFAWPELDEELLEDEGPPDDELPPLHALMHEKIIAGTINFDAAGNRLNGRFINMRLAHGIVGVDLALA